ncbi:MAG TPA: DUF5679 domain-containing protein [Candidatus Saccharimonadales bacterium]|nr:DUF5679 domain-containing protein [Candidatus Saccharimonadales bacterium]
MANGYCVKCKASREIKDAKAITMKNGRPATQGTCPVCGTKIFKIGASEAGTPVAEKASSTEHAKPAAPEHEKA